MRFRGGLQTYGSGIQKIFFFLVFMLITFEGSFKSFFKDKVMKKSQNSRNQGLSYYFGLMMEGSGKLKKKNTAKIFYNLFLINNCTLLMSEQQEKPSTLKRENPALKKSETYLLPYLFSMLCGSFLPSWIQESH
jgi:hypothetical protein